MRELTEQERAILQAHTQWVEDLPTGSCADLREADLWGADLRAANLRAANLREANLRDANLRAANLRAANLREANLRDANLRAANLWGADLDFSAWPLWCGSGGAHVDIVLVYQLPEVVE